MLRRMAQTSISLSVLMDVVDWYRPMCKYYTNGSEWLKMIYYVASVPHVVCVDWHIQGEYFFTMPQMKGPNQYNKSTSSAQILILDVIISPAFHNGCISACCMWSLTLSFLPSSFYLSSSSLPLPVGRGVTGLVLRTVSTQWWSMNTGQAAGRGPTVPQL